MSERQPPRARGLFGAATAVALVVAVVFATIGDGVEVAEATGLRAAVIDGGHTLVWVLLTVAFAIATVRARWSRLSNAIAIAAGITYALFLVGVFVWR
ncbi:hypothetical protein [Microbacterium sp. PRC9]|uniref:hypothetical protein n=1 Tax=Microbacterium sp. PRC9 TaxID=2962591 RepID=UPI002880E0EC|nr:hypothetical protein [Microbacterium sp. PRC9]MDT0143596.1 hypothetical protein [Microbacterium sp. PRC9]